MLSPNFRIDSSHHLLTNGLLDAIDQIGTLKTITKGEAIVNADSGIDFFFFIKKGIFKTWKRTDEKEFILGFTFQGDVDGDPSVFLNSTKSQFSIEAVITSEVIVCKWIDLESFLQKEKYLLTVNYFLARYVSILQNRLIESIAVTAEDRYKDLIKWHVQHLDQIPVSDLARYLGITIQSLSRIRSAKF